MRQISGWGELSILPEPRIAAALTIKLTDALPPTLARKMRCTDVSG
jgi:hypothetical protein